MKPRTVRKERERLKSFTVRENQQQNVHCSGAHVWVENELDFNYVTKTEENAWHKAQVQGHEMLSRSAFAVWIINLEENNHNTDGVAMQTMEAWMFFEKKFPIVWKPLSTCSTHLKRWSPHWRSAFDRE